MNAHSESSVGDSCGRAAPCLSAFYAAAEPQLPDTHAREAHDYQVPLMTMNSKSLRRLAGDHGSLHTAGLPPNYLFPPDADASADLTSLDVLLSGPVGTPYASGVWRLHLDIPPTYPSAAPTAFFRTRCWHPNVDEATGAVCVETLKRDWSSTLKLRDVLVTISCLLIQPNPASALNEEAGKLANEDWAGFCRRAKLMTEIHAAVPTNLAKDVREAQMRGEEREADSMQKEQKETKSDTRTKGKERVKATSAAPLKLQRTPLVEDEENTRRRGRTADPESDESDWIPSLNTLAGKSAVRGLGTGVSLEATTRRNPPIDSQNGALIAPELPNTDPFMTVTAKRTTQPQASFIIPISPNLTQSQQSQPATHTPELLKFSHENPFSAIQPNNQQRPLFKYFSNSWVDAEALCANGSTTDREHRDSVKKRLAGNDFEKKRDWEMKRFKKAGCDLRRYNRGDFGPRTGIGRL